MARAQGERGGYKHLAEHDADGGREAKGDATEAEDVAEARRGLHTHADDGRVRRGVSRCDSRPQASEKGGRAG